MNLKELTLRCAGLNDADSIATIHHTAWLDTHQALLPEKLVHNHSFQSKHEIWSKILHTKQDRTKIVLAESSNLALGFGAMYFFEKNPTITEITALYVKSECRGLGIGRSILNELAKSAWSRNVIELNIWVLSTNTQANAFYKNWGAEMLDSRHRVLDGTEIEELRYVYRRNQSN